MNFESESSFVAGPPGGEGIVLYGSNDPEELVRQCAENLHVPLSDPFAEEEFLVQSKGMATWLTLQLAERLGVCANARFRFPEETIWMILGGFLGDGPTKNPYTKEAMAWYIYDLLPTLIDEDSQTFAGPARYLDLGDGDRALRLCWQLAGLYDSYQTYRPDMILDWSQGELPAGENRWQGLLWLRLREAFGDGNPSLPELWRKLGAMDHEPRILNGLPERLAVFGISTLPPVFLDVLQVFGRWRSLGVYALQPAPVQWGDVKSEKWRLRALSRAEKQAGHPVSAEILHVERGNALIGSLGRTGREFFNLLVDRDANDRPLGFREPSGDSLLYRLQRSTFDVFAEEVESKGTWDKKDESVTINSCHGPMRETEVLRDYLLRRFSLDDTLEPKDVVVLMPDPEAYAPYLRATFGSQEAGLPHFPFSIVDREPRQESHLVDTFFGLMEFVEGRATNCDVLDLMDSPAFRLKFDLQSTDLVAFRHWIRDCHAHWGFDAEHRERLGSAPIGEHTWRRALDRMALGFCMRGEGERSWEGILPYDEIEGENAFRFAKFNEILRRLGELESRTRANRSPKDWAIVLARVVNDFLPRNNETLLDRERISQAIDDLSDKFGSVTNRKAPLRAIHYHFSNVLETGTSSGQFLTRGITFCGLRPMRSVSARIVCLIGMNDESFPRQSRRLGFDLSGDRLPGDRSTREDDRYLFLETLWCAKDHLYLSYLGQSIRSNQRISPSVVVNETLDAIDKLVFFVDESGRPTVVREALVRPQPLHPFGRGHFDGVRQPRSYSSENLEAAKALLSPDEEAPFFMEEPLIEETSISRELSLDEIARFFGNPSQYFLRNRLGMNLWEEDPPPEESEPFEIDGLYGYKLKENLLRLAVGELDENDPEALCRAEGSLPPGSLGAAWFNQARCEVKSFMEKWKDSLAGRKSDPLPFEGELGGFLLRGEIGPMIGGRQVLFRSADLKAKNRLDAWLRHLCASAFLPDLGIATGLYAKNKKKELAPLPADRARDHLERLLGLYEEGMRKALPFFAESSLAYFEEKRKECEGSPQSAAPNLMGALVRARSKWDGGMFSRGEKSDPAYQLCFREEPFGVPAFGELAEMICGPMIEAEERE